MSYNLKVSNQSNYVVGTSDGTQLQPGQSWTSGTVGSVWVSTAELGTINFLDIGETHIGGDSSETWGVLISYQGEEVVGRYEGGGELSVTVNKFGQAQLSGMDLRQVALPSFILG
jgi:hypothetical protein